MNTSTSRVLVWDKSGDNTCSNPGGDREQRWAVIDCTTPTSPTILKSSWQILQATEQPPAPLAGQNPGCGIAGHQGLFCAGQTWLPDGRLFVLGGDYWAVATCTGVNRPAGPFDATTPSVITPVFAGSSLACVFDPSVALAPQVGQMRTTAGGSSWHTLPPSQQLRHPRWYPSVTLLPPVAPATNARVAVSGGIMFSDAGILPFVPAIGATVTDQSYDSYEFYTVDTSNPTAVDPVKFFDASTPTPLDVFPAPLTANAVFAPGNGYRFWFYPRMHFTSDQSLGGTTRGQLWMSGQTIESSRRDLFMLPTPSPWLNIGPQFSAGNNTLLEESVSVLFPGIAGQLAETIVLLGGMEGNHSGNIVNTVRLLDTRAVNPQWVLGPPMNHARKFHNAVVLPDSSVFVVGGGLNPQHGGTGQEVHTPEVFFQGQWHEAPQPPNGTGLSHPAPRTYHSQAVLLPDARVLVSGGDTCGVGNEYEIFEPHYLFQDNGSPSVRPTITQVPNLIGYGAANQFTVNHNRMPIGLAVTSAVIVWPAALTHGHDSNQRLVELSVVSSTSTSVTLQPPANNTRAIEGHYMLFLLSSAGVPSVARWVRLL